MSLTKQGRGQDPHLQKSVKQRIWKVPISRTAWNWLLICILLYCVILAWYLVASRTVTVVGPFNQPFRFFGIVAFALVLSTAGYSLRRRFVRGLPGRVQDWLWMHTWLGITALLIAFLHENFLGIFHQYCSDLSCLTQADGGISALYALLLLVASGIIGRIIDVVLTRVIAHEASSNGVGIVRAVKERLLELEYTIERFAAGKSEAFQHYARQMAASAGVSPVAAQGEIPSLPTYEQNDFQQMIAAFATYVQLTRSLRRQELASRVIRSWRIVHSMIACMALVVILSHAALELLNISF
jgi:hypothetical protein